MRFGHNPYPLEKMGLWSSCQRYLASCSWWRLLHKTGLLPKHAIKQVDRLLSNSRLEAVFATWVPETVGSRTDIVVAMDWTDFDADGQATLALKLVTVGRRRWSGSACSRTS